MSEVMIISVVLVIITIGTGLGLYLKKAIKRESIEDEFQLGFEAYEDRHKSSVLIDELKEMKYLPKLKGFQSVITLLKYRHRARSLRRFKELHDDWKNNKL